MNWDYMYHLCQSWGLSPVMPNCKAHVFFLITCHLQAPMLNLIRIFILVIRIFHLKNWKQKIVVQSLSRVWLTLGDLMDCSMPGFLPFTISWRMFIFLPIESVRLSNHLILRLPLLLLPSILPRIRISSNESSLCIRWPECWSFSISPSN